MKKRVAKMVFTAFVVVLFLLVGGIVNKREKACEQLARISSLPDFTIPTIDGSLYNTSEISEGPVLITYFHPECEHCQYEISSLAKSNIPESGVKILLVSYASRAQIRSFMGKYDIKNDSTFHILSDTAFIFSKLFNTDVIPSNFIYNEDLRLVKILKGETNIETITKYLQSGNQY